MGEPQILAIFLTQLVLLLLVGRMLGEGMARMGQPAIFGQLLAGVVLGPSLFGALFPGLHATLFPSSEKLKTMIDSISQVGVVLLLLLTGMETNLELVRRKFHVVLSTSLSGIAIPFACGVALGFLLPNDLVPDEGRQLITALFLGTALSISSIKIVAMVLMEVGFIRRDLGQLILATAVLDDTIAWILVAVIAGISTKGTFSFGQVASSIAGVVMFLGFSLTLGRRLVAKLIQWSNDTLMIEFPVITAVLVLTLGLALTTELIGVHLALGAFVGGVLIGQSPILKGHIEQELRGMIVAFFSPVFFAVAGLGMDLTTLAEPHMSILAITFVAVATIGKSTGALIGGRLGGLSGRESLALATGLNARGSTEVIIATIGLSMGVLNSELYTLIVAMAVITTLIMPPTLRWTLARVPMRSDERERLEKEEAAEKSQLPNMERVLVTADGGANGALTLRLAGAFAAERQILTTILERSTPDGDEDYPTRSGVDVARGAAESVVAQLDLASGKSEVATNDGKGATNETNNSQTKSRLSVDNLIQDKLANTRGSREAEAVKGYSIVFIGLEHALQQDGKHFTDEVTKLLEATGVPAAICFNAAQGPQGDDMPRNILVPVSGTQGARLALEIAVAFAQASGARLTILHVIEAPRERELLRESLFDRLSSVLHLACVHAERNGVNPTPVQIIHSHPNRVVRRMADGGTFDLVVLGTELREDEGKFLGPGTSDLIRTVHAPMLLVAS